MKKSLLVIVLILVLATPALAIDYACHDQSVNATSGKIIHASKDGGPAYASRPQCVEITSNEYLLLSKWHKILNGQMVEMTQVEKDALIQVETDAEEQKLLDKINKYDISNIDLLTALVKVINVRIPGNPITKAEIISQIKSDLGL